MIFRKYLCISFTLLVITVTNTTNCKEDEEDNFVSASVKVTDNKTLKKIEVRNLSNSNATFTESPTAPKIQQGNNVYIKPKFIIGSSITSYKQGNKPDDCCEKISFTSKVSDEETNIMIGKPNIPQIPSFVVPPPVIVPSPTDYNIVLNPPRFSLQPQSILNPCGLQRLPIPGHEIVIPMHCPSFIVPVTQDFQQPPKYPIYVERPVRPILIPKPPELPPIILPHLPIQVLVQNAILTKPLDRVPIIVPPSLPMVQCVTPGRDLPSFTDIFTGLLEKFKNLITIPSKINFTEILAREEKFLIPDSPIALSTMCAQSIIAQRVVPNIIKNNDVKLIMSTSFRRFT